MKDFEKCTKYKNVPTYTTGNTTAISPIEPVVMCEYSQGICEDGAAILCAGQPLTIEEILFKLRESENTKKLYEHELNERMSIFARTIETMTNSEWDKLRQLRPDLHSFVRQAVNR